MSHHHSRTSDHPAGDSRTSPSALSRRVFLAAAGAIPLAGALPVLPAGAAAGVATAARPVVVDVAARRQTIQGFGGMNHPVWRPDLTPEQRETAFGNGADQLGFTIVRIPVPEDRANWEKVVETARYVNVRGGKVIAAPWNPPADLVETFDRDGTPGNRLRHDAYGAYARHLNDFIAFLRENGVDLYAMSIQNEPDYAHGWTWWTPQELLRFMRDHAGSIQARVMAPESFQYVKATSDLILQDPQALANLDILGTHLYGIPDDWFAYPLWDQKGAGKELWATEIYHPNSRDDADTWPQALDVGENIHRTLVDGGMQTYIWWYICRYYGPLKENGVISKRGWNMAHWSKFVRPGYVRVDATAQPADGVFTSAFVGGGGVVVVAVNKGTTAVEQRFDLGGAARSNVASSWLTDATRNLQVQPAIRTRGGGFTAALPPESVTTFKVR
ncbi:glucuronoxylanase [Myceligenerans crystallogenes]|uniref:Glucuronoarabinoxylan endo-1,4-beta-xylanase XynC n=1 Tax=Myceligenerans crystallogenes TaxID=316335 RepID=A0ABN2N1Y8_9MICO